MSQELPVVTTGTSLVQWDRCVWLGLWMGHTEEKGALEDAVAGPSSGEPGCSDCGRSPGGEVGLNFAHLSFESFGRISNLSKSQSQSVQR